MNALRATVAFAGRVLAKGRRDELAQTTSALAFSTLIALVPLVAGVSVLLARTLRSDDRRLLDLLTELLPYREESIVAALQGFLDQAASLSGIAILGFLLTSLFTFFEVQSTLFRIFAVERAPSLGRRLVTFSLLFFWGPLLVGLGQTGYLVLGQTDPELARELEGLPLFGWLPNAFTLLGLAMLYWRAALRKVRFGDAALGALAATVALELLTEAFQVYVAQFTAAQRAVYGTFAILFFFVLSIRLAWWILLYGAEIAAVRAADRDASLDRSLLPRLDAWIGLAVLELLAEPKRPARSLPELAARLRLDPDELRAQLAPLGAAGLLEQASGGFRLALSPHRIRVAHVLATYRRATGAATDPADDPAPRVSALRERLGGATESEIGATTLADLIRDAPTDEPLADEAPPIAPPDDVPAAPRQSR